MPERPQGTLKPERQDALEALLPALVAQWAPGITFTSRQAWEHISDRPDLVALFLRGEQVDANAACKRIGKLLIAAADSGQPVCGLRVERGFKSSRGCELVCVAFESRGIG